jgi:riboflavin kinase/FMN adenylyltransferase
MFDAGYALLEVFLFDFTGDIYGQIIEVAFIGWIRPELKFDSLAALVEQMKDDSAKARTALARRPDAFPRLGTVPG